MNAVAEALAEGLGRVACVRPRPASILLAVSGGPDSLALLLAAELAAGDLAAPAVFVATVDHGLRPESSLEARRVGAICAELGLPHRILAWTRESGIPPGNLQAAAREARYRLLAAEARRIGAAAILTAHHRDDQIETHWMARARGGTGPALAGMRAWRDLEPGLVLLRPFLDLDKAELRALVDAARLTPVEDPTNADPRYLRARVRADLADGALDRTAGLAAIASAAAERRRADEALAHRILALAADGRLTIGAGQDVRLADEGAGLPAPLLSRLLATAGGALHPPPSAAVERLAGAIDGRGAATLGGCLVERCGEGLRFSREYGRAGPSAALLGTAADRRACFDRRFDVVAPSGVSPAGARVVAFGALGRGSRQERTLPILLGADGEIAAVHPALAHRERQARTLTAAGRAGWRLWADLPGAAPAALTAEPQIAANPKDPVGKDLADTYLR